AGRLRVPFHVEHGRQRGAVARYVADVPGGLFLCRAAEIVEMIGAAGNAGRFGRAPVLVEIVIDAVAAFGRLDEGKGNAACLCLSPINRGLVFGDIGAVDGMLPGRTRRPLVWIIVVE